jgi:hypothetical protein
MSLISEIQDDEILGFLMTSEFEGDYSPEELKYLLFKWRFFYRIQNGSLERIQTDLDGDIRNLKSETESLKIQVTSLQVENANKDNLIMNMENKQTRVLTWRERISGKIKAVNDKNMH